MIYGATDEPSRWRCRLARRNVFDRMAALGLEFLGPQHPERQAGGAHTEAACLPTR